MGQSCCGSSDHLPGDLTRRGFVHKLALGAGVALFSNFIPSVVRAANKPECMVLSCLDFRVMDDLANLMWGRKLHNKYDHIVLAGASLAVLNDAAPAWGTTFWDHLALSVSEHGIKKVIVVDHRDCAAYKAVLGPNHLKTRQTETEAHTMMMTRLRDFIKARYGAMEVELLLMGVDGKTDKIG